MSHDESSKCPPFMMAAELFSHLALENFTLDHFLLHQETSIAICDLREQDQV